MVAAQLPPRSETNVIGCTVYRDLADTWDTWVSKPGSASDELRISRAAVPSSCKNIPIRVMNVTRYPVTLAIGAVLADLEAVEIVGDLPVPAGEEASTGWRRFETRECQRTLDGIDPTVRSRLEKLCVAY